MGRDAKSHMVKRSDLITVHQYCPKRPYIELRIPKTASSVSAVTFAILSRDQGWSDAKIGTSFTHFSASVQRPRGRPDIRTLTIFENRPANPEFFLHTQRWNLNDGIRRSLWIKALEGDDVIQLIPRATYFGWVNIIKEATIKIEYEVSQAELKPEDQSYHQFNVKHFTVPLNHEAREIRLLTVRPGGFNDPISGSFSIQRLSDSEVDAPVFHALSYCWSTSTQTTDINIQPVNASVSGGDMPSTPFRVTKSVQEALKRLRRPKKALTIWVDSICINQSDLKERAQQVTLMGDIYSQAAAVHIWLGENDQGIEACLRIVRDIFNYNHRNCPGGNNCNCFGTPHSIKVENVDKKIQHNQGKSTFRGMQEVFDLSARKFTPQLRDLANRQNNPELQVMMPILFNHPWFSRVWVVQEAILSRRASVHCSGEIVPWKEVFEVSEWLENPHFTKQREHIPSQMAMAPIWKTLGHHRRKRHHLSKGGDEGDDVPLPNILEACLQAVDLKATDPRDKIFALFPFGDETTNTHDLDPLIKPNYVKSVETVFADFTRWWIKTHKSLAILSLIHTQPGRAWQNTSNASQCDLHEISPSWCFQSEGQSRWAEATLESQFDFRATSQGPELILLDSPDTLSLTLTGLHVSQISAIGYPPAGLVYPHKQQKIKWEEMARVFDKIIDPCSSIGVWTEKTEPGGRGKNIGRKAAEYEDHLKAHWAYFPGPQLTALGIPDKTSNTTTVKTERLPSCIDKCFFVTSDGWFGLCPWTAKEGDTIALLAGARVPYLLRPVRPAQALSDDQFKLVGECYVEGIMHGEAWSNGNNVGPLRVFRLV